MRDRPDAAALLDMVAELLRKTIVPELDGAAAYQARIAANVVAIVAREIRAAPIDDAVEHGALRDLLGQDGDVRALNTTLVQRIADGTLTIADPHVADHLWRTTLAKLAVDQPGFARLREYASNDGET